MTKKERALKIGAALADEYFYGRKGHGGTDGVVYVNLRRDKLAILLALAAERGMEVVFQHG